MTESEEELNSLFMRVKEENEKAGLKLNIQKTEIMASDLIPSWQIDGETMKTVIFFFGVPKSLQMVTAMILKPKKRKSVTTSIFSPSICHAVLWPDAMILIF